MVMATSDRARDLAVLRLAGATRWQVLRLTGAEALTVVAAGALLGLLVAAVNLAGMASALALLSAPATIELPWQALGTTTAVCAPRHDLRTRPGRPRPAPPPGGTGGHMGVTGTGTPRPVHLMMKPIAWQP